MSDILKNTICFTNDMECVDEDAIIDSILRIVAEVTRNPDDKNQFEKIKRGEGNPLYVVSGRERVVLQYERLFLGMSMEDHKVYMITLTWHHFRCGLDAEPTLYLKAGIQPEYSVGSSEYVLWTPDGRNSRNFSRVILEQSPYTFNLGMCKNALLNLLQPSVHSMTQFEKHCIKEHEYYLEMYTRPEGWLDISRVVFDGDFDGTNEYFRLWHNCTYATREFFVTDAEVVHSNAVSRTLAEKHLYSLRTLDTEYSKVLRDDLRKHSYTEKDLFTRMTEDHGFCNDDIELFNSYHTATHSTITLQTACMFALTYLAYVQEEYRRGLVVKAFGPCCVYLPDVYEYREIEKFYDRKMQTCIKRKNAKSEKRASLRKKAVKGYLNCDLEFD